MGTMSEPVRGKSAVGFPSALLAFLSFEGCLSFGLASPPPGLVTRLRFPKLQTVQCRVKERGGWRQDRSGSLLNVVLFHSERACSYASARDATVSSVYLPNRKLGLCRRDRSFERALVEFGRIIIHGLISWDGQFGELIVHLGAEASVEVHDTEPCAGQVHLSDFQIVWIVGAFGERHVGRFAVGRAPWPVPLGVERAARGVVERGATLPLHALMMRLDVRNGSDPTPA